jgi:hypothetical protein
MIEGKKIDSYKKDFEIAMFFSSQNINFPFYLKGLLELYFFLPLFSIFCSLSLSLSMLHLFEDLEILMINEEKNTLQKFLFR